MSTSGSTGVRPPPKDSTEPESAHLVPQPGGQHPVELGQRPECGVAGAGDRATRAGEQRDRGGDRLLVVEKQRRQVLPRPRGSSTAPVQVGAGDFTMDYAFPEPVPAAFTTIAWRLGHVIVGVLAARNAAHFGAPAASYETWEYAGSAATALDQLEAQLDVWLAGVRGLGEAGLRVPVGAKEPFPEAPMADLVLHLHRELIHHLSEVCLLCDLYLHTKPATNGATR
jgi:hypothetical protein